MKSIYNFFHHHYHHRYHDQYAHAKKLFVIDLVLLTVALMIFIIGLFFFFWKPGIQEWIDLKISFGEKRVKSGESVAITINYANRSKFVVNDISLALHLPPGFIIDRAQTPTTEFNENSLINLSQLPAGAKGQKIIHGTIWVETKTPTDIIALMSYRQENSKTREQKSGRFILNLSESVLQGNLELTATSTLSNNLVPFVYKIKNSGAEPVAASIVANWNNSTAIIPNYDYVIVPDIETIVTGTLKMPSTAGNYPFAVNTFAIINGQRIVQLSHPANLEVYEPRVSVGAILPNGQTFAEPNQTIPMEIYWKNNSAYNLIEPRLYIHFTPGTVNLKATARENNLTADGDELLVTADNRTTLANGSPGASDRFTINLKLLPHFQPSNNQENIFLEISPILTATLRELPGQNFTATGASAKVLLATEMSLSAQTRYYTDEGDQLGRGPLPPQLGETTKYWVYIQARNTTNPAKDANFSAILVPGVQFTGRQSVTIGSPLKFNEAERTISWNYHSLPANSQTGLYFEVAVNPAPEQINQEIPILKNIKFEAVDDATGKKFDLTAPNLTNKLPANDPGANKI